MADWLPDLDRAAGAKYQVIADAIAAAVVQGALRGGDRLPPQRALATRLGVDLTTVTRAYEVARDRGLVEARGRLGSFVREPSSTSFADLPEIDTGMNMPPELPGGRLIRAIADGTDALLRHGSGARLHYQPPGGALQDRIAGARLFEKRGLDADAEQVVLTAGGQNALHAILGAVAKKQGAIACGSFVYSGIRALAARLGLRLLPLPVLDAAHLERACARGDVAALYLVPTNDNPTTHTVEAAERKAIAQVARRHDLQVIEDDAYGPLAADPLAPVASFAPERCWHVASVSKIISPALRVAYVRAPDIGAALRLASDVHETAIMAPPINAALVSNWIVDGTFDDLVSAMRDEVVRRRELAEQILAGISFHAHQQGYHLWIPVANGLSASELADAVRGTGLSIVAGERFAVGIAQSQAIRVSLGGLADLERLAKGLRILNGHLSTRHDRSAPLV